MKKRWPSTLIGMIVIVLIGIGCTTKNEQNQRLTGLQDGLYFGFSESFQDDGWAPFVRVEVVNGKIEKALFDFVDSTGSFKSNNRAYDSQVLQKLASRLIESQALPVDIGTEDPEASTWFNILMDTVTARIKAGDTRPVLATVKTSVYTAEDQVDTEGWIGRITIGFNGQSIASVAYEEVQLSNGMYGISKMEDTQLIKDWSTATGIEPSQAIVRLGSQLSHEGRPSGVDIIAGATITSHRFRSLAQQALSKRKPLDFIALMNQLQ